MNCLKVNITLRPGYNKWHIYLHNVLTPLIKDLRTQKKLLHFDLKLKTHAQPLIVVSFLVRALSANDLLNHVQTTFDKHIDTSKNYKKDNLTISTEKIADADFIAPRKKSDLLISQAISYAMLGVLAEAELDDDLVFTFGIYLLFAAYNCSSFPSSTSVAKTVYEFFMSKSTQSSLATDRIFHSIKHHTVSSVINEVYEEISQSKIRDQQWLHNFADDIGLVLNKANNEGTIKDQFITINKSLRAQLNLTETSINLLNYSVWQTFLNKESNAPFSVKKSLLLEPADDKKHKTINNKIPLLTYYSPSHASLFNDFFLPSYKNHLQDDFELFVLNGDQLCAGLFEEDNWNEQVKQKIIFVNEFIQTTNSDYVVFSDVDIIFYKNIRNELMAESHGFDITFQNDSSNGLTNNLCSGFYCCQVNNKTRIFFKEMVNEYQDSLSDQQNLNLLLPRMEGLTYKALSSQFYNFSHAEGGFWFDNKAIAFPKYPIIMYHANYTIGTMYKKFLLQVFRDWDNMFF